MKWAVIVVRSLMGLLFLFASITFLFKLITPPPLTGAMKTFNDGLVAATYLLPTAKVIELPGPYRETGGDRGADAGQDPWQLLLEVKVLSERMLPRRGMCQGDLAMNGHLV